MSKWLDGRVVENRRWTETLFSLRIEAPRLPFEAGQFVKLALDMNGVRVARPFSFVNPPEDPVLEFYGVVVPEGPLSPRLARLAAGDAGDLSNKPPGVLVLSQGPPAQTPWLLATGAGIAPFLSILRTEAPWRRYRNVVLAHAARRADELVYRELLEQLLKLQGERLRYVTFVSREPAAGSLPGRIPAAILDGRLEAAAGRRLAPETAQVMLCGNPGMLKDATGALAARGMKKHRRRSPGQITVESFW